MSAMSEKSFCEIGEKGDDFSRSSEPFLENHGNQELKDELQRAAEYFQEARDMLNREREEWQRERNECLTRERDLALELERCREQMQAMMEEQQRRTETPEAEEPRRRPHLGDILGVIRLPAASSDDSEDEPVENLTDADENEEGEPLIPEEEDPEDQQQGDEEEEEDVLEYSPVGSTDDIQNTDFLEERKRKAVSPPTDEADPKRARLVLVECPVCLETLPEIQGFGKILVAPPCGHVMCSNCAMRMWLLRKNPCAGCKKKTACCPKCHRKYNIQRVQPVYL